jgi:hypothetical protein
MLLGDFTVAIQVCVLMRKSELILSYFYLKIIQMMGVRDDNLSGSSRVGWLAGDTSDGDDYGQQGFA